MIEMRSRNFIIKVFVFILSNLLPIRDLVDTQQLIFPIFNYTIFIQGKSIVNLKTIKKLNAILYSKIKKWYNLI